MADIGPKIPSFIDQIQFIKYYVSNPCDVPYTAYIETALPIAGEIASNLLLLDLGTFVKSLFKPKWVRTYRHTRRGREYKGLRRGIPEPAEVIAETLDRDGSLRLRTWPMGTYMLVQAAEIIDRVFWTIFLFEMIEGLYINSIIGVIEDNSENCEGIRTMLRSAEVTGGGGAGPTDYPVPITNLEYQTGVSFNTQFACQVPEGRYVVVFSGNVGGQNGPITCTPAIIETKAGVERREDGPTFTQGEQDYTPFVVSMRVYGPCTIQWRMHRGPGFFTVTGANLFLIQTGT